MKDELTSDQANHILKALDEALTQGPWDASNFLRVIGQNLQTIRDQYAETLATFTPPDIETTTARTLADSAEDENLQEIFITLYSTEGALLSVWEKMISNLPYQMISRPIYGDEEHAKAFLRSKDNRLNEAYIGFYIDKSTIIPCEAERGSMDRLGHPLLKLKDRALSLDRITRFVHVNGVYRYVKGRLIKS